MAQGVVMLVGCTASTPAPVASVEPPEPKTPEHARPEAEAEDEPEPETTSASVTTVLRQEAGEIGWIETLEDVEIVSRDGDEALVELPFYLREGNRSGRVQARVSAAALSTLTPPEPTPALRVVVHHALTVLHDDGTPISEVRCGEVEVLGEQPDRTRVRIRTRGVVIEGWVAGQVAPRGTEECPPRVLPLRPARAWIRGQPRPEPEPLPEGFVQTRDVAMTRTGSVWWLVPGESPSCERWRWRKGGTILEHRTTHARTWYVVGEDAEPGSFVLFGPSFESLRPGGGSGVAGCVLPVEVVDADDDRWVIVSTTEPFVAYHREDAQHWFRSARACNEARGSLIGARAGC